MSGVRPESDERKKLCISNCDGHVGKSVHEEPLDQKRTCSWLYRNVMLSVGILIAFGSDAILGATINLRSGETNLDV